VHSRKPIMRQQQTEASEQSTRIPAISTPLQTEDLQPRDTAQATLQEALSARITNDIQATRSSRQFQSLLFGALFLLMVSIPFWITPATLAPFLWGLGGWLGVFVTNNFFLQRMGGRLAKLQDPRAVGALLDVFNSTRFHGREVRQALIRLLPRVKAGDSEALSREQRQVLYTLLTQEEQWLFFGIDGGENLKVAALKALEQVGDEESIPVVSQVAERAGNLRVRQAAEACLRFLHTRVEQTRNEQTLLRATLPPAAPSGELLRPASEHSETASEQLLRPHVVES
jgi:hypothetical protein